MNQGYWNNWKKEKTSYLYLWYITTCVFLEYYSSLYVLIKQISLDKFTDQNSFTEKTEQLQSFIQYNTSGLKN